LASHRIARLADKTAVTAQKANLVPKPRIPIQPTFSAIQGFLATRASGGVNLAEHFLVVIGLNNFAKFFFWESRSFIWYFIETTNFCQPEWKTSQIPESGLSRASRITQIRCFALRDG
jgi:hypothetical protein